MFRRLIWLKALVLACALGDPAARAQAPGAPSAGVEEPPPDPGAPEELPPPPPVRESPPPANAPAFPPPRTEEAKQPTTQGEKPQQPSSTQTKAARSEPQERESLDEAAAPGPADLSPFLRDRASARDDAAIRVQAPGMAIPSAAGAVGAVGQDAGASAESAGGLPLERIPLGRQTVGLSVEVQAPSVINLHQQANFKIIVRNPGASDAQGVIVRDLLPEGLVYVSSQPAAVAAGRSLTWNLNTLSGNSERVLTLRVKAVQVGSFDHAATVEARAASKSRTMVQEPKLRVEQTVRRKQVLKGGQVEFNIAVSNPGTGAARNVVIDAQLSQGLHHMEGKHIQQTLPLVKPGERIELEPLAVEAQGGGDQTCIVTVKSPDVPQPTEQAPSVQKVEVVEPRLILKITGPPKRFTDTVATYTISVDNPGTVAARNVRVSASLPAGGTLLQATDTTYDRQYDRYKRRLIWTIPSLGVKDHANLTFSVRLGGMQEFHLTAEARTVDPIAVTSKSECSTTVTGMPEIKFSITESRRVIDVNEEAVYEIRIRNQGSKEASGLIVTARLSKQLDFISTGGTDANAKQSQNGREVIFPVIDHLAPNGDLVLWIRAKAKEPGVANCEVEIRHDDLDNSRLSSSISTRITESGILTR